MWHVFHCKVVAACLVLAATQVEAARPPHIVFALADDLGWNNVGFQQLLSSPELAPEVRTPTIDELARTGLRLDRMYSFKYCSPSRSSFLSGRLPLHVTQNNNNNLVTNPGGADLRMELLPQRLREVANYSTAIVGKWHVGARSQDNLPVNRGFDTHFGFLKGGEDHQNQHSEDDDGPGTGSISVVDLWRDTEPAYGENGTFSTFIYAREASRVVRAHAAQMHVSGQYKPLFLFLSWQAAHTPLEVPPGWSVRPVENDTQAKTRAHMNALVEILDQGMQNVTETLRETGMWNDSLVIFQADNGGWIQNNFGGNNFPLRGGKVSDFEGGVRNIAVLNGGWLDDNLRGTVNTGLAHICDWYATFEGIATRSIGALTAESTDGRNNDGAIDYAHHLLGGESTGDVPPSDSIDLWSTLIVPNATSNNRTEVPLSFCDAKAACDSPGGLGDAALISGHWKIVLGSQGGLGWHQGPRFPNASTAAVAPPADAGCVDECLFDVFEDPGELHNLREQNSTVFDELKARLDAIGQTTFQTNYSTAQNCVNAADSAAAHHGFLAPRCS